MTPRLSARPPAEPGGAASRVSGVSTVGDGALLYVPPSVGPDSPGTLLLTLHGAGGTAQSALAYLQALADTNRLLLLAPSSRSSTWDVIVGAWGPDVAAVDRALHEVFAGCPVDPGLVAVSGFSDGASYALSLGLANGDLFTHVVAFSPGFVAPVERVGQPRVYLSHGTHDRVLPIAATSRRIVPRLRSIGYDLQVREFAGGHAVPPDIAEDAVRWLLEP